MPLLKGVSSKATPRTAIRYITREDKAAYVSVRNLFEDEDYAEMAENQFLYPDEEHMPNVEYFHNLPQETLTRFSELWNEIKMAGGIDKSVYIGFAVTAVLIVGYLVYKRVQKRRREYWYDYSKS